MKTKALIVGINDYSPAGPSNMDLSGCVKDARDYAETLTILGFDPRNILILTDAGATKANIMGRLQWLIDGAKPGDSLVFAYSGHGSTVVDLDGDERDRADEVLCPHDTDFYRKIYITDDELRAIFSKLPKGVTLDVFLDSCHSGTATRSLDIRSRYLPPPIDFSFHDSFLDLNKSRVLSPNTVTVSGLNHVLWAGCRDNQTSAELQIGNEVRGVFSYTLCQVLRRSNGKVSRDKTIKLAANAIKQYRIQQTPQLEATAQELKDLPFA